jgi:hypothetical protein
MNESFLVLFFKVDHGMVGMEFEHEHEQSGEALGRAQQPDLAGGDGRRSRR